MWKVIKIVPRLEFPKKEKSLIAERLLWKEALNTLNLCPNESLPCPDEATICTK